MDVEETGSAQRERLAALRSYGVLDTPREAAFDDITNLVARLCHAPIAVVNLIDESRQWFKAEVGIGMREMPLDGSICAQVFLGLVPVVVNDLTQDARFACLPLVQGSAGLRFYAGAPLVSSDGHALGTLCVLDTRVRELEPLQRDALVTLAAQVMAQLELRRLLAQSEVRQQRQRLLLASVERLLPGSDVPAAVADICASVGSALGLETFLQRRLDGDGTLALAASASLPALWPVQANRIAMTNSLCAEVARTQRPCVIDDAHAANTPGAGLLRDVGLRAYACHPLVADGRVLGTLAFASREPQRFSEGKLGLLQAVTTMIAAALLRDTAARERSQLAMQLKERELALRDADRRKDDFLATLAHELRNPLAPIRNATQLMALKDSADAQLRWSREVIERQVNHLTRLVDDLLDVSRISRDKINLKRERIDLTEALQAAVETSRPAIELQGHVLRVALPDEPIWVDGDAVRLAQVFMNLLTNAAKYTDRGGWIELQVVLRENEVAVQVRDNGIGVAADQLPHMFEMFYQVESALNRTQGGLGIGLALVKRLVEMHGGTVHAASAGRGHGSSFEAVLPRARAAAQAPHAAFDADLPAGPRRKVLVADDNVDAAQSLAMLLQALGHDVRTVHDGHAAVEEAERFAPDVALLDLGMPKADGFEAARRIRRLANGHDILLVALTGWGQAEDRRRSHEAGFDRHLVKPAEIEALVQLLA